MLGFAAGAQAAPGCSATGECPPLLRQFGSFGHGAGELYVPRLAADPATGDVFVVETGNARVSQFSVDGTFIKAWGWGVRDGAPELQTCTAATGCLQGQEGAEAGELQFPLGIAVDEEGNLWVPEPISLRVQKFSPQGEFLLMVGGEVNKTKVEEREEQEANAEPVTVTEAEENLCTAASGDVCAAGTSGTGSGQFKQLRGNNPIDVGPGGTVFVGDEDRIQKFAEDGSYEGDVPLPGAGNTESLTVAPSGRLYVISGGVFEATQKVSDEKLVAANTKVVREIGPAGEELSRLKGEWEGRHVPNEPRTIASDAEGNVYVSGRVIYPVPVPEGEPPKFKEVEELIAFDPAGALISFEADRAGFDSPSDSTNLISIATNVVQGSDEPGEVLVGHFFNGALEAKPFIAYIRAYGRPFEPEVLPPTIEASYATAVGTDQASVEALIKPGFTADTTYQVEYGTGSCSAGECETLVPATPAALGGGAGNTPIATGPVAIEGLAPGTTYHFRFRAENEVTDEEGTGPVFGAEGSFTTFAEPVPPESCPNDALRLGAAEALPDCRAYEMVSPVDKEGGQIRALGNVTGYPAGLFQGSPQGDDLTYTSYRAFADPKAAPFSSQYLARRDPASGWVSEAISPPREGVLFPTLETQYRLFSGDLDKGWLVTDSEPALDEGAPVGQRNLYRRDNDAGSYQVQCPAVPEETPAEEFQLEPQGKSADGSHLVFWANGKLTPDAAAGKVPQVYECVDGTELRLVSVLPSGEASAVGGSTGTDQGGLSGFGFRENNVTGAVSSDGSRIFWTAAVGAPGPLYVRIGGTETVQIAASNARFRAAAPDGTRVIYSSGSNLFEASVEPGSATSSKVAGEVDGFMGASEDTRLLYLVSREDLDGAGPAAAGNHNLYLYRVEGGSFSFVAALSADDSRQVFTSEESAPVLSPVALSPFNRSSRVSADGLHAAFTSTASLTGYDNTDQGSGEADAEAYLYEAGSEELHCVSCNPGGARPRGVNASTPATPFWAAAVIPGWANQFHAPEVLAADGARLFFEAYDALALGDTNGAKDVYEWEAPGTGTCTEASPSYSPANGGCVELISSGKDPQPSSILDGSAGGRDVFFTTNQSLWPPDPGAIDVYDARVGGGFAPPPPPPEPCEGEGCQSPPPPPAAQSPSSTASLGSGNVTEAPPKRMRCRKGTHKVRKAGKVRCVKNKHKHHHSRRAGR